ARGQEAAGARSVRADEEPVREARQDLEELLAIKMGTDPIFPKRRLDEKWGLSLIFEKVFGYLAAVFLAATMLLTVADVALRAFFNRPIHGMFELIEL